MEKFAEAGVQMAHGIPIMLVERFKPWTVA